MNFVNICEWEVLQSTLSIYWSYWSVNFMSSICIICLASWKNSVYLFFFPFNLSKYVQHTRRLRIKWTAYAFSIEYCAFQLYVLLHCSVIIKRRLKVTAYLRGFLLSSGYIFITVLNQILSYTDITISSVNNLFSLNISKKIRSVNNGIIKIHQYPSIWPEC